MVVDDYQLPEEYVATDFDCRFIYTTNDDSQPTIFFRPYDNSLGGDRFFVNATEGGVTVGVVSDFTSHGHEARKMIERIPGFKNYFRERFSRELGSDELKEGVAELNQLLNSFFLEHLERPLPFVALSLLEMICQQQTVHLIDTGENYVFVQNLKNNEVVDTYSNPILNREYGTPKLGVKAPKEFAPKVYTFGPQFHGRFLLCSDGVIDNLQDEESDSDNTVNTIHQLMLGFERDFELMQALVKMLKASPFPFRDDTTALVLRTPF